MEEIVSYYDLVKKLLADIEKHKGFHRGMFNLTLTHIEDLLKSTDSVDNEISGIIRGEIRHYKLEGEIINLLNFARQIQDADGKIVAMIEKFLLDTENFSELLSDRLSEIFIDRENRLKLIKAQIKKTC